MEFKPKRDIGLDSVNRRVDASESSYTSSLQRGHQTTTRLDSIPPLIPQNIRTVVTTEEDITNILSWGAVSPQNRQKAYIADLDTRVLNHNKISTLFSSSFKSLRNFLQLHLMSKSHDAFKCFISNVPDLASYGGTWFISILLAIVEHLQVRGSIEYETIFPQNIPTLNRLGWIPGRLESNLSLYYLETDLDVLEQIVAKNWGLWQLEQVSIIVTTGDISPLAIQQQPQRYPLLNRILPWISRYHFAPYCRRTLANMSAEHPADIFLEQFVMLKFHAAVLHQLDQDFWLF